MQIDEDTWVDPSRVVAAERTATVAEVGEHTLVHIACEGGGLHCLLVARPLAEVVALLNGTQAP